MAIGQNRLKLIHSDKIHCIAMGIVSEGNYVTYCIDTNNSVPIYCSFGTSALEYTPTKNGWTFVGWREDKTASGEVLKSKIMGMTPITLYAVFKQTVTVTYYNNSTTKKTVDGIKYYNNGNIVNPSFTLSQSTKSGWSNTGWSDKVAGNSAAIYQDAKAFTRDSNITLYGLYKQTVVCTFSSYANNKTVYGTRYYNSSGDIVNASVVVPSGATDSNWTWRGYSAAGDTAANASVAYNNGDTINDIDSDKNYYGLYQQTIYLYYDGNGAESGSNTHDTGTRYYNTYGNTLNPTFTLRSNWYSKTYYSFTGWDLGAVGTVITLSSTKTAYAQWQRISNPVSWYNGNSYGSGYPSAWTITSTDVDCNHEEDCEIYCQTPISQIYANHNEPWSLQAQATGSTGGNQYMEVVVGDISEGYATLSINGTSITSAGTYKVDVTGLSSVTMSASLGGHEYAVGYIAISSIRFY